MSDFRYKAFISYSHDDEKWARWLHRWLERYRMPEQLVAKAAPASTARLKPVFRDRDELSSAASLSDSIQAALESSESLIVICSPGAAVSKWVNEEIRVYQQLGRASHIFCLIVEGESSTALPAALTAVEEPLAADLRQDGKHNAALKIAAGLLNVGFDELRQRETQARQRRMARITGASVAVTLFAVGLAWFAFLSRQQAIDARFDAEFQRTAAESEAETSRQVTEFLLSTFKQANPGFYQSNEPTAREILDQGAMRVRFELQAEPRIRARLLAAIGGAYLGISQGEKAIGLLSEAIEIQERQLGKDRIELVPTLLDLAEAQTQIGGDAEYVSRLVSRALEIQAAFYGPDSAEVAEILIDMSSFSTDAAAGAMLRRAREIAESAYPGATIHGRALLYSAFNNIYRGELEQARRFLEQAIEIQEAHDQTTGLVESLSTLGSVYDYAGATEQSIAMLERAVQLAIDLRGDTHPWTAGILNNLAVTHHRQGNLDQALPYYQRALNIAESSLGPRSGLRRTTLTNLGELERDRGAYEQSEKYLGLAAQLQREIDGQIEAYLTGQIALLRLAQGRHNEALELFDSYFGKDGMPSLDPEHTPILEGYARLRHELGQNQ